MFTLSVKADIRKVAKALDDVARQQLPFATAQAINATAEKVRLAERDNLLEVIDGPTPFTLNSVAIKRATKSNPGALVYVKPVAAAFLLPYEIGGKNKLNSKALLKPVGAKVNQYGNLPRNLVKRIASKRNAFIGKVQTKNGVVNGRDVYVEDDLFARLDGHADEPVRDAMDLAYLAGQRPQDTLNYDERDVRDGFLMIDQGKTGKKLRMEVTGELKAVIDRIKARKATYKVVSTALVVTETGQRMTLCTLQYRFRAAREAAGIPAKDFQFRDLRAKAGTDKTDSTGDIRQAQKQLGHGSVTMTEHYVRKRRGDKVGPTR